MVGCTFAPRDGAFCDGPILPIIQSQPLYSRPGIGNQSCDQKIARLLDAAKPVGDQNPAPRSDADRRESGSAGWRCAVDLATATRPACDA